MRDTCRGRRKGKTQGQGEGIEAADWHRRRRGEDSLARLGQRLIVAAAPGEADPADVVAGLGRRGTHSARCWFAYNTLTVGVVRVVTEALALVLGRAVMPNTTPPAVFFDQVPGHVEFKT